MAQSVLVIADSGTGKSTSIRKLDPKRDISLLTLLIQATTV